jgi:predicted amidohydrolase
MVRVAAVQMRVEDEAPLERNVQALLDRLEDVPERADLVLFPGMCLSGLVPRPADDLRDAIASYASASRDRGAWTIFGAHAVRGDKTFNEAYVVSPEGDIAHTHQKTRLSPYEAWFVTPGTSIGVARTPLGSIGVIECYELSALRLQDPFPEPVDLVACIAKWIHFPRNNPSVTQEKVSAYFGYPGDMAGTCGAPIVVCDGYGEGHVPPANGYRGGEWHTISRSQVLDRHGTVLCRAEAREQVICADVPLRSEGYGKGLGRKAS